MVVSAYMCILGIFMFIVIWANVCLFWKVRLNFAFLFDFGLQCKSF